MAYTTIDDPSAYFNTLIWSGDNTTRSFTGLGFSPDWTWIKSRSDSAGQVVYDSVRGNGKQLQTHDNGAEQTNPQFGYVSSFDSDGFTLTPGTYSGYESGNVNMSGRTYVGWNWRGSDSSAVSNTDGSITSTVSANTTAGFSIVTYTGTGSASTVGHGLGVAPKMLIVKERDNANDWKVYHHSIGNDKTVRLDTTDAQTSDTTTFNSTTPTSSVFSVNSNATNRNGGGIVAYCFAEIEGYSKFGSYTGNGSSDGPFVYTGFRPAWLMIKRTDSANTWYIWDNKRNTFNVCNKELRANTTDAETTTDKLDFLSNGFKIRATFSSLNASGGTYIYLTFAEHPFVSSEGVPVTAR